MIFVTATALLALWASDCCTATPHGKPNPSNGKRFIVQLTRNTKQSGFHSERNYKEEVEFDSSKSGYSVSILVGNPSQEIKVDLDTGSSDLWVRGNYYSNYCDEFPGIQSEFFVNCSSEFEFLGDEYNITYGGGIASGIRGKDIVQVAGLEQCQYFGVVNKADDGLLMDGSGGTLGLALKDTQYSFLKHLKRNKMLNRNVFSVKLTNDQEHNSIEFGGWDETIVRRKRIHWIPIVHPHVGHWRFHGKSMSIGSHKVISHKTDMVADSGCTNIVLHPDIFNKLKKYMRAEINQYKCLCVKHDLNLQLKFKIKGKTYALDWKDFAKNNDDPQCPISINIQRYDNWQEGMPKVILGDPFLRKFYTIHDFGSPSKIAFVPYQ